MIIIEGWIRMAAEDVEAIRPSAAAMMAASVVEDGCVTFAFAQDLADPELFRIVERWRDEEALAAHFQAPHMAEFQEAMGRIKRKATRVDLFQATFKRVLRES